ncbi:nuclear transport factor 2 family protein [Melissospora conviva]|uniref:nuclear transport factor 2 family protein n=1 Tax=Melissospora conviva TaxID=3388432 RepID=UPI003B75F68B
MQQTLARYAAALDQGDPPALAGVLTEDASWTFTIGGAPGPGPFAGRAAILDFVRGAAAQAGRQPATGGDRLVPIHPPARPGRVAYRDAGPRHGERRVAGGSRSARHRPPGRAGGPVLRGSCPGVAHPSRLPGRAGVPPALRTGRAGAR